MDAIVTVRLDKEVKERTASILRGKGLTLSSAVQQFFDYVLRTGDLPFAEKSKPSPEEIERRLEAFRKFQLAEPLLATDEEIRASRIRERYDIDAG
ncbi:MAG: type II toxin-antitoxin system RelB/DinJ family antitoxin [Coriobacteriales bacterium]|jgi:addiction module RelB/DinJ family antitoxin|nr:type II toxin-antitoxin system RelB/DinJ family antitoxin [Coriobacteriales bacterium]